METTQHLPVQHSNTYNFVDAPLTHLKSRCVHERVFWGCSIIGVIGVSILAYIAFVDTNAHANSDLKSSAMIQLDYSVSLAAAR